MKSMDLTAAVKKAIEEARRDMGRVNVLIAGRTGVGKSTLINSIFHGRLAATGQGEPVTKTTRLISKDGVPIAIWDTRGLELSEEFEETLGELMQLVETRAKEPEAEDHIHVAWLCVHEDGRRVEDAEDTLCRKLALCMPVIGVITKARSDNKFRAEVQRRLPEAKNVVRVRALSEVLDDGHPLPPMGLPDLVEATANVLPEGIQRAFATAQKVSLRQKEQQAHAVVAGAAASAAAAGAVPIPFADAVILVPIQVSMLAGISVVFGLDTHRDFLRVLVTTATGATSTTLAGRAIVANLLKLVPGGIIVGGTVSAVTATVLTTVLGEIYIASLVAAFTRTGGQMPEIDAVNQEFTARVKPRTQRHT